MRVLVSWLFILTWMEQVGLWMAYARPCARGWNRFKYGPCATRERARMRKRRGEGRQHASRKAAGVQREGAACLVGVCLRNEQLRLLHAVRLLGVGGAGHDGVLDLRAWTRSARVNTVAAAPPLAIRA